jgi:hypothetical protein
VPRSSVNFLALAGRLGHPRADHRIARDELGECILAHALRTGRTHRQNQITHLGSRVPHANLDVGCQLGAQVEGAQCATPSAQCALQGIENAAQADIAVQERGVRIQEACLVKLEIAVQKADDPREIKIMLGAGRRVESTDSPDAWKFSS